MPAASASGEGNVIVDEEIQDSDVIEEPAEDSESDDDLTSEDESPEPAEESEPDLLTDSEVEPGDDEATATPVAAAEPAGESPKPAPFVFKGDKAEQTLEGAQYYAGDGLYVPEAQVPKLKQMLSAAAVHNGSWQREKRDYERKLKGLSEERNEKDVAADAITDLFNDLSQMDEEQVYEWALSFKRDLPSHRLSVRERQLEHRERTFKQSTEPTPEERDEQLGEVASTELTRTLDEIFKMPAMKVLDDADRQELRTRFSSNPRKWIQTADRDDPALGVRRGELLFDGASILEQIELAATLKGRAVTQSSAAATAAAANRRKVGSPAARTPAPARSSSVSDDTPRDSRTGRFKTKEEYMAWINDPSA